MEWVELGELSGNIEVFRGNIEVMMLTQKGREASGDNGGFRLHYFAVDGVAWRG
jgi:hypothetical protein